ncbi:hypothetical protein QR680_011833 [Steinernema hermaphroditum]|uniref:Uncharacterized protein n=1 Tax=Steinernema hermaphroditum TaxID=289476 RepID=A0AA39I1P2_9BILA|nr:hypothetical protein QR680_011833 [Steinernema hermaphroditum]
MQFIPFAAIDEIIALLTECHETRELAGYWSMAPIPTRTDAHVLIDVFSREMTLENSDPSTTDYKEIRMSNWGAFMPHERKHTFNLEECLSAINEPLITRRRQLLEINYLVKAENPLYCSSIINAIAGNFSHIEIRSVRGYATEIEQLFSRIASHRLPSSLFVVFSDITKETVSLIMKNIAQSQSSRVTLSRNSTGASKTQLKDFFVQWNQSPCEIELLVCMAEQIETLEELRNIVGSEEYYATRESSAFGHKFKKRVIRILKPFFEFCARE